MTAVVNGKMEPELTKCQYLYTQCNNIQQLITDTNGRQSRKTLTHFHIAHTTPIFFLCLLHNSNAKLIAWLVSVAHANFFTTLL